MIRVRQDYEADRRACRRIAKEGHPFPGLIDLWQRTCSLPEDCEQCKRYVCAACERASPWDDGGSEDALCDACWQKFIGSWFDAQDKWQRGEARRLYEVTRHDYYACLNVVERCSGTGVTADSVIEFADAMGLPLWKAVVSCTYYRDVA